MIYAHFEIMYDIILDAPRLNTNFVKSKLGPHANGIVGSVETRNVEYLDKQLHELSMKQSIVEGTTIAIPSH